MCLNMKNQLLRAQLINFPTDLQIKSVSNLKSLLRNEGLSAGVLRCRLKKSRSAVHMSEGFVDLLRTPVHGI